MNPALTAGPVQVWIGAAVQQEVAAGRVGLPSLVGGDAASFVRCHAAAVLALAAGPAPPVTAVTCPETLLFDVGRLSAARAELDYVATAAAMLVTVAHSVGATRKPADMQVWRRGKG